LRHCSLSKKVDVVSPAASVSGAGRSVMEVGLGAPTRPRG
jgi:hypothetical protein